MTNEKNCILANVCKIAGSSQCTKQCPHAIALHGASSIGGRVAAANVPRDYRLITAENMPTRDTLVRVANSDKKTKLGGVIDSYAKSFTRQFDEIEASEDRIKSMFLYSRNTGTGKSTTASALIHTWIISHYIGSLQRSKQALGRPAYFVSVNNLQQLHNKAYSPASASVRERLGDELMREIELAKKTPFVVLDDMAVRKATVSFVGVLYDIADYRTSNRLPTVITSNKTIEELAEFFYEEDPEGKVVDRLSDLCMPVFYEGESKRGLRRG